jgi:hypothetical protein
LVPKYQGGPQWGEFFRDEPKLVLADGEYKEIIEKIKTELGRLEGRE